MVSPTAPRFSRSRRSSSETELAWAAMEYLSVASQPQAEAKHEATGHRQEEQRGQMALAAFAGPRSAQQLGQALPFDAGAAEALTDRAAHLLSPRSGRMAARGHRDWCRIHAASDAEAAYARCAR